ncbi:phenylpyruvate tautomerase MIF-related protein [Methylomicrobium sp. Wu6]|uniref:phenylpyruvate tautomerase MIF-related protein n=1 Tax=Methylomicrobium sp. Wu6 TaxID=3107928 RepID=UPI002DD61C06|nr:phenylpyruvate tautomerase MIF-related protein [Methylomicrobium sp. Wu6]MEC4748654.1 phenylpyruvate tautomerase MIF-related protein [Methylomicrobium sp. Wu6]
MPYLKLNTNVAIEDSQSPKLLSQLSQLVAKETGKPERYVLVELNAEKAMLFAGSSDPLAFLECKSIGLSAKQAKSLSAALSQLLWTTLTIPPERIYIEFSNCPAEFWGWNGSTFD